MIDKDGHSYFASLEIKNVTVEDAGKYKVTAKNELGESNATISLNFDSKYRLESFNYWFRKQNTKYTKTYYIMVYWVIQLYQEDFVRHKSKYEVHSRSNTFIFSLASLTHHIATVLIRFFEFLFVSNVSLPVPEIII